MHAQGERMKGRGHLSLLCILLLHASSKFCPVNIQALAMQAKGDVKATGQNSL